MISKIIISIDNNKYIVTKDSEFITSVCMESLVLNGKDLYNNLFSKLDLTKKINFEIELDSSIIDSKDKRLTTDIKQIIEQIIMTINDDLNLEEEVN